MKLFFMAAAALISLTAANADAQWVPRQAPDARAHEYERWREPLAARAHTLSEEASHLSQYLGAVDGTSHLSDDARALASLSEYFHQSVEGGAAPYQLTDEFRSVAREYGRLARGIEGAHHVHHDSHFAADWASMEQAFAETSTMVDRIEASHEPPPPAYSYQYPAPRRMFMPWRYRPRGGVRIAPRFQFQMR